jgi:hypothetical protein
MFAFCLPTAAQQANAPSGTAASGDEKPPVNAPASDPWTTPAGEELLAANSQHFYIALPISRCFHGVDITDFNAVPGDSAASVKLLLYLQPDGQHRLSARSPPAGFDLNNFQSSVLYLSEAISRLRSQVAGVAAESRRWVPILELLLVGVSALATVAISIKAVLPQHNKCTVILGILAIILSAASTAGASLSAFFSPADVYSRNETALVQLRQLHHDLAFYVAGEGETVCNALPEDQPNDPKQKALKQFHDRLAQIVTSSGTAKYGQGQGGAQPGTTGSGQQ